MKNSFLLRMIVVQSIVFILLAAGWSVPGLAANGRDSVAARNSKNVEGIRQISRDKSKNLTGTKSTITRQKLLKVQKAIETAKKISVQAEAIQKMQKNREEL
ncbi:MAG: hypothetical protein M1378_04960, partial [Bacteroidetes bacterium]|nr:hypothetical protein [Bacteroidota bacterium]